jgi:hypothetical protein
LHERITSDILATEEINHAIKHLKPYRGFSRKMRDSLTAGKPMKSASNGFVIFWPFVIELCSDICVSHLDDFPQIHNFATKTIDIYSFEAYQDRNSHCQLGATHFTRHRAPS